MDEDYTAVLYARVSTDDKGQTNETQVRDMIGLCNRQGWRILDVYQDEQTATNDRRPGFRALKGRITEGDVDYVVARNQDRISREPADYQNFIEFCKMFRVRVRYCDNGATPETVDGVILDSVQSGLAKADNMKRSASTKSGMETARLKGIHCGRPLAFCWSDEVGALRAKIQTEGDGRTVIASVDTVLDLARQGMTVPAAARALGVSATTLKKALGQKGLSSRYSVISAEVRRKGMSPERVVLPGEKPPEREGAL